MHSRKYLLGKQYIALLLITFLFIIKFNAQQLKFLLQNLTPKKIHKQNSLRIFQPFFNIILVNWINKDIYTKFHISSINCLEDKVSRGKADGWT